MPLNLFNPRPRALDLFCGAGGASRGLHRAGFSVTGVDNKPQPRYPFAFIQGDALEADLSSFDFVWASPPCQRFSTMSACRPKLADAYPDLIAATRDKLQKSGLPFIIENVPGAPLFQPLMLCGTMFDLPLYRHRLFECSFVASAPPHPRHLASGGRAGHWKPGQIISVCGNCAPINLARAAMDINWMTRAELSEAIPPAYAEFLGKQAMKLYDYPKTDGADAQPF